jgi:hypothetical protein
MRSRVDTNPSIHFPDRKNLLVKHFPVSARLYLATFLTWDHFIRLGNRSQNPTHTSIGISESCQTAQDTNQIDRFGVLEAI